MKIYRVKLTPEERVQLREVLSKGTAAARTLTHTRILLKADEGVDGRESAPAHRLRGAFAELSRQRAPRPRAGAM